MLFSPDIFNDHHLLAVPASVGLRARKKKDVVPVLQKALELDGPVVVECVVEPEENVYPMVPPGASLTEMLESMA